MLTKPAFILNFVEARKGSFLCLFSIVILSGVFPITSVLAQSEPVYTSRNAGQTEIRLQQMEKQIRQLTGNVEEQVYEINSLKQKIKRLERKISESSAVAPQIIEQSPAQNAGKDSGKNVGGRIGSSHVIGAGQDNPLGLDLSAQKPTGMQTATVVGGNSDATVQYEAAYASLKKEKYNDAQKGFEDFLSAHGDHILAANAKYWLGETYYVRGDYKKSARIFAEGFQKFPDSAKSPDILLKLGLSLKGMGKNKEACITLGQIPTKFPTGNESVLKRAEQERAHLSCDV